MPEPPQRELFPAGPELTNEATIAINARCVVKTEARHRVVLVAGMPLAGYVLGDAMAEAHAMVSLIEQGWADQNDVARAFGRSERTVRRYQRRFEDGGLVALGRPGGYPRADHVSATLVRGWSAGFGARARVCGKSPTAWASRRRRSASSSGGWAGLRESRCRALPKAHVARMRIAMPATTDYWVNDATGEPLFVVTAEANAGLAKMLPPVCDEIRKLVGERRVTIVFDRGGWSPKLFQQLIGRGFDILTYRKGTSRRVAAKQFTEHRAVLEGREVVYTLADQGIRLLGGKLRMRQVTRRSDDGHQTPIVTSRSDLSAIEVAYRMFERWRQENFFKYLREEYALDALVDYQVEPADPMREVPNPAWNQLTAKLRQARSEVISLSARYGIEALVNREAKRPSMRGFKIANAELAKPIRDALARYTALEAQRAKVPSRIPVGEVVDGDVIQLTAERKHLTNVLKMVAYQVESDLVRRITPHYRRADDEARTLVQSVLANTGDLAVTATELRVTFAPLSSPHRTAALVALCAELDALAPRFPGTRLRVRYAVAT